MSRSSALRAAQRDAAAMFGFAADDSGIVPTDESRAILESIGGVPAVVAVTTSFYETFHTDKHIQQFLGGLQQPLEVHASRLGKYICEMMGAANYPWTKDTEQRDSTQIKLATGERVVVRDRATAHYCAWNSVDRPREKVGRRFKLDDCRVWMRLFFWAMRRNGYSEGHPWFLYMQRFIAHFISIYETTARIFTLTEARWSSVQANLDRYVASDRFMADVVAVPYATAITVLPAEERKGLDSWLYLGRPLVADRRADDDERY